MAFLSGIGTKVAIYAGLAVLFTLLVFCLWFQIKARGKLEARIEGLQKTLEAARTRASVERDIAKLPDPVSELRRKWSR